MKSACPRRCASPTRTTSIRVSASRFGPLTTGRYVIRGGIGIYTVPLYGSINYSLARRRHERRAAVPERTNSERFRDSVPERVPGGAARDAGRRYAGLQAREPVRSARPEGDAVDRLVRHGSRVEHRRARQLRRIEDGRSRLKSRSESGAFEHGWLCRGSRHPPVYGLERRHDPRQRREGALRRSGIRAAQALLERRVVRRTRTRWPGTSPIPAPPCRRASRPKTVASALDLFRGDADYGNVAFTRRHRFVSTFLYALPIGRGRAVAGDAGAALDVLVGGWDVTGITLIQSGAFLTPQFSNADPSGTGATVRGFTGTQRPDCVGDGNSRPTRVSRHWSTPPRSSGRRTTSADSAAARSAS